MDETSGRLNQTHGARRSAQDQLSRAEKMRLMGEMASGVVHDFNNLLGAIIGRVQLSLCKNDLDEIKRNLAQIEKIAMQGGETLKRLQAFTRQENQSEFLPFDLSEMVSDALEVTRHRWEAQGQRQGIDYEIERKTDQQCVVLGIRSELVDVVANLIFNALDAMPEGGRLSIETLTVRDRCRLVVADTGGGMTPDQIEEVFRPFYSTKGSQGTGLGLAVAFGIISHHGGEIKAESEPGESTRIIIDLPATKQREIGLMPTPSISQSSGCRVLLVDDDHTILDVMGEALRDVGHVVDAFDNGAGAIEAMRSGSYHVVVTDLGMPEITGWEVARQARVLSPPLPVVVISGWGAHLGDGIEEVDAILAKPFHLDQLRETITQVTSGEVRSSHG
jgi:CheY-like chemotaxis protein